MATITGTAGGNVLTGDDENDVINGLGGQDHIRAGGGADTVNGGDAADGVYGGSGDDSLNGDAGDDVIGGGAGADTINGGDGRDTISGSGTELRFFTNPPNVNSSEPYRFEIFDRFANDGSVDILNGGAGADTIVVAFGDQADGGTSGSDIDQLILVFTGMPALNINLTTQPIQEVASLIGATVVNFEWYGVVATEHADVIVGSEEADLVWGQQGDDDISGAGGADFLVGGTGADHIAGGSGNDSLYHDGALNSRGGVTQGSEDGAVDILEGGDGTDVIYIGYGDIADGGGWTDTVYGSFMGSSVGVTVNLTVDAQATLAAALGATLTSFENFSMWGSAFNDVLTGSEGSTTLVGDAGDDVLNGGDGNDLLRGGTGRDTLYGGTGADLLFGGAGADTFYGGLGNDQIFGDSNSDNSRPLSTASDVVIYSGNRAAYNVTQDGLNWVISGAEGVDTLYEIERVQFADMTLTHWIWGPGGMIYDADNTANDIYGTEGGDDIRAGGGDDVIHASPGSDVVDGGEGFDTFTFAGRGGRVVVDLTSVDYQAYSFYAVLATGIERWIGDEAADAMTGDGAANTFEGGDGDDSLSGAGGDDRLVGGKGDDHLDGGPGNDTAVFSGAKSDYAIVLGDDGFTLTITDLRLDGDGVDTVVGVQSFVFSDGTYAFADLVEPYAPQSDALEVTLGQASSLDAAILLANDTNFADGTLTGVRNAVGASVALVDGRLVIIAGAANASFEYTAVDGDGVEHVGTVSVVAVTATAAADSLTGSGAVDASDLVGLGGADILTGGAGRDRLVGGLGNDRLDGGLGADLLIGGSGGDIYRIDNAGDLVVELAGEGTDTVEAGIEEYELADNVEKLVLLAGIDAGAGNALNNTLVGNDGDNHLNGRGGADLMQGGAGDDTYIVDDAGDVVQETTGVDTVITALATYTLGSRVEILRYSGTGDFHGIGSAIANSLFGGDGDDTLDGKAGADILSGGLGADLYLIDNAGDVVVETGEGEGDEIVASVSYVLGAGVRVETLRAAAGAAAINLTGGIQVDTLIGNDGANLLDGGYNGDVMRGGLGDDTYVVDTLGDLVDEAAGAGFDTIRTSVYNFTLAANVEQLVMLAGAGWAKGNALDNVILGNSVDNAIDGGLGADRMVGGLGGDQYTVDNAGDVIVETGSDRDGVTTSLASYTLGALVEDLQVVNSGPAFTGTGNSLDNSIVGAAFDDILTGLAGNDLLWGMGGADTMNGGLGNDIYLVDDAGDLVIDAGVGIDEVRASISYTLTANVENLGISAIGGIGTGNGLNNVISGTLGQQTLNGMDGADRLFGYGDDDILNGGAGADYLDGGEGVDTMRGGAGDDTYIVDHPFDVVEELAGEGIDTIRTTHGEITLGANVENVIGVGEALFSFTGNGLANSMTGGNGPFPDYLYGRGGDDKLFGLAGDDYLYGDEGNDVIDGGAGADSMIGGLGNDTFIVDDILDAIGESDGEGLDSAKVSIDTYSLAGYVETLIYTGSGDFIGYGNELANTMVGGAGIDALVGGAGADTLRGGGGIDSLYGGDDNDKLYGEAGDDVLSGENGVDYLYGGAGSDNMNGGAGKDFFVLSAVSDSAVAARDVIELFESLDVVSLSAIDADAGAAGNQAFSFIGAAAFSGVAGQLRYAVDAEGGHLMGDVDGDGVADLEVLFTLGAPASLTAGNLIL